MDDKLMTQGAFECVIDIIGIPELAINNINRAKSAYAAALARIAEQADKIITLEAQIDALREQVDRLLSEAAHA